MKLPKNNLLAIIVFDITIVLSIGIPLFFSLRSVLIGNIPFWYDNARDMILAWNNLHKPTLIGPTSGIPGIFYGPYWIWLLSLGVLISKDPRIATLIVGIIPYFVIFPIILILFSKLLGQKTIILIWLLFIFNKGIDYATSMWSPNLAPLLFLIIIYLLLFNDFSDKKTGKYLMFLLAGIVAGLLINFHISFGVGVLLGICVFLFIDLSIELSSIKAVWKPVFLTSLVKSFLFGFGVITAFIPFLLFETRHGFNQTKTAIDAILKYGDVVNLKGLNKEQILQFFLARIGELLHINGAWIYLVDILILGCLFYIWKHNNLKLQKTEKKLVILLFSISSGILFIYLTAKNPVWSYHFIGTELIFLFLIAFIVSKIPILGYPLTVWVAWIVISSIISFTNSFKTNPYVSSSLFTKEYIVDIVANDAKSKYYTIFNYSPSIYQYEYTYLFRWRHKKDVPYDPSNNQSNSSSVYLIIPSIPENAKLGYINYRTPNLKYKTTKTWDIPDGTTIIKRE